MNFRYIFPLLPICLSVGMGCAQKAAEREKFERMDRQLVEEYTRMAEAGDE